MKHFVLQSYKTSGEAPSDDAFREKALLVLKSLSIKQVGIFETKFKAQKAKEKALFRTQRKPVEAGAHGTLSYKIKKGVNKNKIADEKILKSKN